MRPKARETTHHGSPPGWLEEMTNDDGCFTGPPPSRLAGPRAAKPVLESKYQLQGMPSRSSGINGSCRLGESHIFMLDRRALLTPWKTTLSSLHTL